MKSRAIDMTGQRYGSATAVRSVGLTSDGKYKWLFLCDCGNEFEANGAKFRSGEATTCQSCAKERVRLSRTTHGMGKTVEYRTWTHIKSRCYNSNVPEYADYGGRGISVCSRWLESFENFLHDMGPRPSGRMTIDRYPDNDGNYEPGNCRWATYTQQANNTRANRKITINGDTKNMAEWAKEFGLRTENVFKRLKRGKSGESILKKSWEADVFDFNGVSASIPEWSAITGIKKATLYWRINTNHWPIEKALTKGATQC